MDNQTTQIELPLTGYTVVFAKYLTIGQSRDLQRVILAQANYDQEKGSLANLPVDKFLDMQDKAAELLIKEIRSKTGEVQPFSATWLESLPVDDGNLVYEKLNDLTKESNLSEKDKKK